MFIVMSFSFGLAIFLLVLMATYKWTERPLGDVVLNRLAKLLGIFIAGAFYFVVVFHLTNLYATEHHGVEAFILRDGGVYTTLFWLGFVVLGSLAPLALIFAPATAKNRSALATAAALVVIGGFALVYVIVIGGQAYPLVLFPGYEVVSSFEGAVNSATYAYSPSLWETLLGFMGVALTLALTSVAFKALRFLPESLDDDMVDPHAR
jgi:molybdopterin-containing oxidoreductase family membrane subunit